MGRRSFLVILQLLLLSTATSPQRIRGHNSNKDELSSKSSDKIVLLNDLSLEQAYLHHSEAGTLPSSALPSASLAQQAARLAAGAYAGNTGHAPGGDWHVRAVYKNLNSVAVISSREEGGTCALAFRGSDDRLDWKNDYRARPFPLMLCADGKEDEELEERGGERFFLELLTRTDRTQEEEEAKEEERRRRRQQQQRQRRQAPRPPANDSQSERQQDPQRKRRQVRCPRRLGIYTLHYGFYRSFRLLLSGTRLEEDWWMLTHNGTCTPQRALMTGHSLGGAFVIYAKLLGWPGIPVTFAAPRAVANGSCPSPASADLPPLTRIYLADDPVPATLPVSDVTRLGIGGGWAHCGCALSLLPSVPFVGGEGEEEAKGKARKEHFAAKAQGCGSNEPLLMPSLLPSPPQPLPPLGGGMVDRRRDDGDKEAERGGLLPTGLLAPADLKRHLHTRYVRAVDEACQGPLDSMRCLFDHEV